MRTERSDELNAPQGFSPSAPPDTHTALDADLKELGLLQESASPSGRSDALRGLQRRAALPETGQLDEATTTALADALRSQRAMLRNAAAAGRGGPQHDTAGMMAQEGSLAMMRFGDVGRADAMTASNIPRTPGAARRLGQNLRGASTASLMNRAQQLEAGLDRAHADRAGGGVDLRRQLLTSLLAAHDELDRRVTAAPLDDTGLPRLDGVEWDQASPLAGAIMDLSPFGQRDAWVSELARLPRPRPPRAGAASPNAATRAAALSPNPATRSTVTSARPQPTMDGFEPDVSAARNALRAPGGSPLHPATGLIVEVGAELGTQLLEALALESAAFVSAAVGPFVTTAVNLYELYSAFKEADEAVVAGGNGFGLEFAFQATMMEGSELTAAVRDGHISRGEVRQLIQTNTATARAWNRQLAFSGSSGPELTQEAMTRGVDLAVNITNQALDEAARRLDQAGVTDPAQRAQFFAHAAAQGSEAGFRLLHSQNEAIRALIRRGAE